MMNRREFARSVAGAAAGAAVGAGRLPALESAGAAPSPGGSGAAAGYKLSVMLWTVFRGLPFPERLEKVAEAGYRAAELVNEFKGWTKQDFAAARKKAGELGMEFDATAGLWHALADASDREAFLKELRDFASTMHELECSRLVLQTGNVVPGLSRETMRQNCIETLKRAGDVAAETNIELLVENIDPEENPKYYLTSCAEGFEIVRAVGHPQVKFLCDFYHEQIAEGNLIAKLAKNIDLIALVHVADVPGRHEPGSGEINYPNIYRKLGELGYNRYMAMEFLPLGEPVAALRAAREDAVKIGGSERKTSANLGDARRFHATA
ncbi:MAG TPA: TIM barrel protein [Candidatus Acidoferrum sp.]|nr:TIM barrel protein [Candidatus Acidoferrum sp.]